MKIPPWRGKDGRALPGRGHLPALRIPTCAGEQFTKNRALRARGLAPVAWQGTATLLKEVGITTESHPDAYTKQKQIPGQVLTEVEVSSTWAPLWAVLVAEAEPCSETCRMWALRKAVADDEFRAALETIAALASSKARRRMADYLVEVWEPEEQA